jgi:hypothetical protein
MVAEIIVCIIALLGSLAMLAAVGTLIVWRIQGAIERRG